MATELFATNAKATLTTALTATAAPFETTVVYALVTGAQAFPSITTVGAQQFHIAIDNEVMLVTDTSTAGQWTVTRGASGTTAGPHAAQAQIYNVVEGTTLTSFAQTGTANSWVSQQNFSAGINLSSTTSLLTLDGAVGALNTVLLSGGSSSIPSWGLLQPASFTATAPAATGYVPAWDTTANTWSFTQNGAGSVTSVGLALPSIFTVTGTPVTSSGVLTGTLATQTASTLFMGPASGGAAAAPTFRALAAGDIPVAALPTTGVLPTSLTGAGTVPLAALGGITNAQLSGTAGITAANLMGGATLNYVLTTSAVNAAPTWQPVFADPETTAGDMIFRNASNVTTRLPVGTGSQVLVSTGTTLIPTWSLIGDNNIGGGANIQPSKLAGGTAVGQVLKTTVANSAPTWNAIAVGDLPTTGMLPTALTGTGTVPLAAISGITNTQLSGSAGITAANLMGGATANQYLKTSTINAAPTWASIAVGDLPATGMLPTALTGAGTVPLAAISGLTNTQLSGTAAITSANLANTAVTAGSYTNTSLTVNAQGQLTAASSGAAPVTSVTGTSPLASSGGATPAISISASANVGDVLTTTAANTVGWAAASGGSIGNLQFPDYFSSSIVSGLTITGTTTTTFTGTLNTGVAYIVNGTSQGRYVLSTAKSLTFAASLDTYIDWDGTTVTLSTVANGAAPPAIVANAIRLAVVTTNASGVTGTGAGYTTSALSTSRALSTGAINASSAVTSIPTSTGAGNAAFMAHIPDSTYNPFSVHNDATATISPIIDGNNNFYGSTMQGSIFSNPFGNGSATAASRYMGATTSGAPTGTTFSFAVGDFVIDQTGQVWICTVAGAPGTWVGAGAGGMTMVGDSGILSATVTSIAFNSIPQTYKHLIIIGSLEDSSTTGASNSLRMTYNGVTTAYYSWSTALQGAAPSTTTGDSAITIGQTSGVTFGGITITIPNYSETYPYKVSQADYSFALSANAMYVGTSGGLFALQQAITSISFASPGGGFVANSRMTLYATG